MSTTYAEERGVAFDWRKTLESAIREEPDEETKTDLRHRASQWPMCACGNQCSIIPMDRDGVPRDRSMMRLGVYFSRWLAAAGWKQALRTLDLIEARSAVLIAQIEAQK